MNYAYRINELPPYLFAEIDRKKKAAIARGVDIISLGVGDPDRPTPPHIIQAAQEALAKPANHQYPFGAGLMTFRQAIAAWMKKRFGVSLDQLRRWNKISSGTHVAPGQRLHVAEPVAVHHTRSGHRTSITAEDLKAASRKSTAGDPPTSKTGSHHASAGHKTTHAHGPAKK